jgi:hypothetical protein
MDAIARLMNFTHHDYLMKATGRQEGNFLACGRVLGQVRGFCFRRPRDFAQIDQGMDVLDKHLDELGGLMGVSVAGEQRQGRDAGILTSPQ